MKTKHSRREFGLHLVKVAAGTAALQVGLAASPQAMAQEREKPMVDAKKGRENAEIPKDAELRAQYQEIMAKHGAKLSTEQKNTIIGSLSDIRDVVEAVRQFPL